MCRGSPTQHALHNTIVTISIARESHGGMRAALCSLWPRSRTLPFPHWDKAWQQRHIKACRWWNRSSVINIAEAWHPFSRQAQMAVKYVNLSLPASNGEYPEEWGAEPFPPSRGNFSATVQAWLKRDVASMWPDVDAMEDAGAQCESWRMHCARCDMLGPLPRSRRRCKQMCDLKFIPEIVTVPCVPEALVNLRCGLSARQGLMGLKVQWRMALQKASDGRWRPWRRLPCGFSRPGTWLASDRVAGTCTRPSAS